MVPDKKFLFISLIPKWITSLNIHLETITITIKPSILPSFFYFCRDHIQSQFKFLMDITAIDYPEKKFRFVVVYHLLSVPYTMRLRVQTFVDETSPLLSITNIYSCANWWEREVWDMFGIFFVNHPDCRRILTDYGFEGHPLRKDFPCTGYVEVSFDDSKKKVCTEPLTIDQEFRYFNFSSPWKKTNEI